MSLETKKEVHETLQWFVKHAPTIKQLFTEDVDISITDGVTVIEQLLSKEIAVQSSKGRKLESNEPILEVIRTNKVKVMNIPAELYGDPFHVVMAPIHGDRGEVIGAIGVSKSTKNQSKLMQVAEHFAASSEEISASTEELASSASDFSTYIKHLTEAQSEMSTQVENTTKILEMINSVAKNTRILGFNAGIEAARSGEYGRGFSVVAKEITKLADQSADSVNEIRNLLDQLKVKVNQVATIVKETLDIANNQSSSINEISQTIQHLTDFAEEIEEMAKKI
ncbi:methyl-accepting chemotaxis protein (MCP) signalling protein [Ureibacillus xyleni]|uniref:Methyl-accepting chemotaxis protein (MCP) signalling protein n=1 Tax=Ureibacillus xyleni TaxID=614648 RepID=A0A285SER8_9BACL|nr:methyl-accepting chemotaxis protein [Ureibacillus xyleni]SOC06071.1 methyl-accepting chemotaxis protein (MCP) signalling protein [Ureibacillus xyleni]